MSSAMPIKPENKVRYPKDWKSIVARIRLRSGNRCEGSDMYPDCRAENRRPHPVTGSLVVLTTAHLNHVIEDCSDENLKHMCQRCHLTYDAKHHAENARITRRKKINVQDMFEITRSG